MAEESNRKSESPEFQCIGSVVNSIAFDRPDINSIHPYTVKSMHNTKHDVNTRALQTDVSCRSPSSNLIT